MKNISIAVTPFRLAIFALLAIGLVFLMSTHVSADQGQQNQSTKLFDAHNNVIGNVIDANQILNPISNITYFDKQFNLFGVANLMSNTISTSGYVQAFLFFESSDCSGIGYIDIGNDNTTQEFGLQYFIFNSYPLGHLSIVNKALPIRTSFHIAAEAVADDGRCIDVTGDPTFATFVGPFAPTKDVTTQLQYAGPFHTGL